MELPKMPTVKDLVPYLVVVLVTAGGAMWARLGESSHSCDARIEAAEKMWQARFDRQESRIDTAAAKVERLQKEQAETYRRYFEAIAKLKKR